MKIETRYSLGDAVWAVIRTLGGSWTVEGPIEINRITVVTEGRGLHESYQGVDLETKKETGRIYGLRNMYKSGEHAREEAARRTQEGFHKLFGAICFLEKQPDLPESLRDYLEGVRTDVEDL